MKRRKRKRERKVGKEGEGGKDKRASVRSSEQGKEEKKAINGKIKKKEWVEYFMGVWEGWGKK